MVQSLVIEKPASPVDDVPKRTPEAALVDWVWANVPAWRRTRDGAYKQRWDSYYNTWRGKYDAADKKRASTRSTLVSPITLMAIDLTVAEIVEAIFGREQFIDIPDNIADDDKKDIVQARDQLTEDLYADGIIKTMVEIVLNGALYGNGIAKINIDVEKKAEAVVTEDKDEGGTVTGKSLKKIVKEKVRVYPSSVEPGQFVPDPDATEIDDMLGCAVEWRMPLHKIWKRQLEGTFRKDVEVGDSNLEPGTENRAEGDNLATRNNAALMTEWHGLVPKKLLTPVLGGDELSGALSSNIDEREMTEAIITIANEGTLLRAIPNPSIMEDRGIVGYQHDTVPNRYHGRGVAEKAFHPQKGNDAEIRARADSLAWINNPMLAGDITKLPPRMNLNAWPGKFWGVRGADPSSALKEFRFGDVNPSTFQQTQEFERMGQQATGALDSIMSIRGNVRDESAGAAAMSASGFIKRSKRTMFNIEGFLQTLVQRILWRKMQFEPDRYPRDFKFQVKGTMGIMAREIEQQFSVQLLQFTEQGTPPYLLILKSIFEASASPSKGQMLQALDEMLKPPSEEQQKKAQQAEQLQMQAQVEEVRNKRADTALKLAQGDKNKAEALLKQIEAEFKDDEMILENFKLVIDQREVENSSEQNAISREKLSVEREKLAKQKPKE